MSSPKVSIIIPTYNRANLLPQAINSVLSQTFKDFELIIIDDCSTDNTKEIIKEFQKKDERIKYIKLEKNSGAPAHPKNVGIENSNGEYIAFLDDDDQWLPEKLEKQLKLFENSKNNLGFVGCNILLIDTFQNKTKLVKIQKRKINFKNLLEGCFCDGSSAILLKKSVLKNVGSLDEELYQSDDWDLWIRISQKYNFDFVNEPLIKYYLHGENLSGKNIKRHIHDLEYILNKYHLFYKKFPLIYSKNLRRLGTLYLLAGNLNLARKYFITSIKVFPWYLRNYFDLFFSFFGVNFYKKIRALKQKIFS